MIPGQTQKNGTRIKTTNCSGWTLRNGMLVLNSTFCSCLGDPLKVTS